MTTLMFRVAGCGFKILINIPVNNPKRATIMHDIKISYCKIEVISCFVGLKHRLQKPMHRDAKRNAAGLINNNSG